MRAGEPKKIWQFNINVLPLHNKINEYDNN